MYNHSPVGEISLQKSTNGNWLFPRHFQQNMNDLFHGFGFICAYIYDLLIPKKGDWTDHVQKLELTLNKLK